MRLLYQSLKYLSISIFVIIAVWSAVFYFFMLEVIHDSIDEGLENQKRIIVMEVLKDSTVLQNKEFSIDNYKVKEIAKNKAIHYKDKYKDTVFYQQDNDDPVPELEPVRLLSTAFEHNGKYYELTIINSMIEESDLIKNLFYSVLILLVLLVVSIVIINNYVLQRLWKSFYVYLSELKHYRLGKSNDKPKIKSAISEFTDLQNTIDDLLVNNERLFENQKQFTGNIAHELQTPLAIVQNKLELLIEEDELTKEQVDVLMQVTEMTQRLSKINKTLLLLTKIENKQIFDNQVVNLNAVVKSELEELEDYIQFKELSIELEENGEMMIEIDPSLASIVVINLIKNAIFHCNQGGEIKIYLLEKKFKITNTSNNQQIDINKIYNRFYKHNSKGSGLGLTLTKAICDLYNHELLYYYQNNLHHFELNIS